MLTLRSTAKVNLYLRVGPRRPDGFHGLVSWFCSVGLEDELEFGPGEVRGVISLTCDHPEVPCDERNLIVKAGALLAAEGGGDRPGVRVHLRKRIPMGGGLGGGSSNAAAALRGLQQVWGIQLDPEREARIAAQLGSDVPFFLNAPSAICRGRGERITRVAQPVPKGIVLLLPPIAMPTPAVYRKFDEMGLGTDLEAVERTLPDPRLRAEELLPTLVNDLEAPAFAISKELAQLRDRAEKVAGRPVRMSGSGSTLFTLCDEVASAEGMAARLGRDLGIRAVGCALGI